MNNIGLPFHCINKFLITVVLVLWAGPTLWNCMVARLFIGVVYYVQGVMFVVTCHLNFCSCVFCFASYS